MILPAALAVVLFATTAAASNVLNAAVQDSAAADKLGQLDLDGALSADSGHFLRRRAQGTECMACDAHCSGCNAYCNVVVYPQTCESYYTTYAMDCEGCSPGGSSGGSSGDGISFIYQGFWVGDYLYFPYYTLIILGFSIVFQIIGTIVVCGLSTTNEPPCWAKCCFPICTVIRFDPNNCGACCGAWCLGWCFTMFCWTPPQRQPMYQSASGAPQVQMMSVVPPAKPPASSNSVFEVEVPQGATPGSSFTVKVGNQVMTVSVPIGSLPGSKIQISAPAPQVTAVAVPAVAVTSVNVV